MKILNVSENSSIYTCNVYLICGTWNAIQDTNTLIDVGRDPIVLDTINEIYTGVGKKRVAQVALTHSHYDHAQMLSVIREDYTPEVCAYSRALEGVDHFMQDGDMLQCGDRQFQVIHAPFHSADSVCLYCEQEGVLFAGDSPVVIRSEDHTVTKAFVEFMARLDSLHVESIYFGHGKPVLHDAHRVIHRSLNMISAQAA